MFRRGLASHPEHNCLESCTGPVSAPAFDRSGILPRPYGVPVGRPIRFGLAAPAMGSESGRGRPWVDHGAHRAGCLGHTWPSAWVGPG